MVKESERLAAFPSSLKERTLEDSKRKGMCVCVCVYVCECVNLDVDCRMRLLL